MITTILISFDAIVTIATTSSSFVLSVTGIGLITIPISSGVVCGLIISNKFINEIVMQNYSIYKKQNEKDHETIVPFDKLYRKNLQDNIIDEIE